MNSNHILVSLVGYQDSLEVAPIDSHIMRTSIAVNKSGAILIKRYITKLREPAAGMNKAADIHRTEFYRYIKNTLPLIVAFIANPNAGTLTIQHDGLDLSGDKYSVKLSIKRIDKPNHKPNESK